MARRCARALCASAALSVGRCLKADDRAVISSHEGATTLGSIFPSTEDPLLRQVLGHITTGELAGTLEALPQVLQNPKFMLAFNTGSSNIQKSVSEYSSASYEKLRRFWKPAQEASVEEFIPMLADVLTEHEWRAKNYVSVLRESRKDLVKAMTPLMKVSSEKLLDALVPAGLPFLVNANVTLASAGWFEACQAVTPIMDKIRALDAKMKLALRVIEATAKMVPMLTTVMPDLSQDVPTFVNSFINLARIDATNVEKVTSQAMKIVVPLVDTRLHCTDAPVPPPVQKEDLTAEEAARKERLTKESIEYLRDKKKFDVGKAINQNLLNFAKEGMKSGSSAAHPAALSAPSAPGTSETKESAAAARSPFGIMVALASVRLFA